MSKASHIIQKNKTQKTAPSLKTVHRSKTPNTTPLSYISGQKNPEHSQSLNHTLKGNIENFIGYTQVPLGIAGPLLINGDYARGSYMIPLATTEGALVASYSRGMKAAQLAGGIDTICVNDQLQRVPYFEFISAKAARDFGDWIKQQESKFQQLVSSTSNYCVYKSLSVIQEGKGTLLNLSYTTADAAGQNMVTLATEAICHYALSHSPIQPTNWYIEANHSGDKKAQTMSLSQSRGKKIIAEITLPKAIVKKILKSTPEAICQYYLTATLCNLQTGAIGNVGHVANALTAIYLACGQDVASVTESAIGILRMETTKEGDLYASLTLPALVVGTVGGGTHLPTQAEALQLIDCSGAGKARKFAEICCATALAGELSIAAAIAENHFTRAHKILGRR